MTKYIASISQCGVSPIDLPRTAVRAPIDIAVVTKNRRLCTFHWLLILLCAVACFVTGFSLVLPGYLAPQLAAAFGLQPSALAPIFEAAGLGNVLGGLICAPLADRFGRKPVIVGGLLFAAPFLLFTTMAASSTQMMWLQFFALFGLMGLVPNALALAGEFVPATAKVTLTMLVWLGFEFGAIVAGPTAALLTASHNWRLMYLICGVMALSVALLLALALPESLAVLVSRGNASQKIARTLRRLDPQLVVSDDQYFVTSDKKEQGFPVSLLFQHGRSRLTILLWTMFFANMLALFFVNTWLPTVLHSIGLEANQAILITAGVHVGGIVGGLVIAELCDKASRYQFYVFAAAYALSGLSIAAIGLGGNSIALVGVAVFAVGFFTFGVQNTANALAATIYPTAIRSTGAGWAIAVGNSAQIVAPLFGGYLLALQWPARDILNIVALSTVVAAIAAASLARSFFVPVKA